MDDGAKMGSGFILCTDSFTFTGGLGASPPVLVETHPELRFFVLKEKFGLDCTIRKAGKAHRIFIRATTMALFRTLCSPLLSF